jgi:hypothetical protein
MAAPALRAKTGREQVQQKIALFNSARNCFARWQCTLLALP